MHYYVYEGIVVESCPEGFCVMENYEGIFHGTKGDCRSAKL